MTPSSSRSVLTLAVRPKDPFFLSYIKHQAPFFLFKSLPSSSSSGSMASQLLQLLNLLVQTFLQLQTMGASYDTHKAVFLVFSASLAIYAAAHVMANENLVPAAAGAFNWPLIATRISLLSGFLAPILLLLMVNPFIGWSTFLLWTICFVYLVYKSCREIDPAVLESVRHAVRDLWDAPAAAADENV